MRIAKFTNDQKERIKQWNEQNPHHIFSLKYCHINVPALNETVFKEQPIPAPTPYQLAQARRDQMAGFRRSQSKRSDEDFSISVPFKPIIDAMGEEIKKQLRAVLPGIIKPLLKDLVSCSTAAADCLQERVFSHPPLYDLIQVKQQPAVTTPMHRGAAAAAEDMVGFKAAGVFPQQAVCDKYVLLVAGATEQGAWWAGGAVLLTRARGCESLCFQAYISSLLSSTYAPLQQDSDYQSHDSSEATPPAGGKRRVSLARISTLHVCSLQVCFMSLLLSQASEVLDKPPPGKRSRGQVSVVG